MSDSPVRPLAMSLQQEVPPPVEGDVALSFSLSPEGEALILWASAEDAARLRSRDERKGGLSPRRFLERPAEVRVTYDVPGSPEARRLRSLAEVRPCFLSAHAMPGDALLLVGGRAAYRQGKPEHNAHLYGADDRLARTACVGDGVQNVATTASGAIWIGYFDEGVIGNYGWSTPIGAPGLNRFDESLSLVWSHPHPGEIVDCYALTITGEDCAICPYVDWPIQRFSLQGRAESWRNTSATGAHALVCSGPAAALVGGYRDQRHRVVAGALTGELFRPAAATGLLTLEDEPLPDDAFLCGRDGVLHAFAAGRWFTLELWQMIDQLR